MKPREGAGHLAARRSLEAGIQTATVIEVPAGAGAAAGYRPHSCQVGPLDSILKAAKAADELNM